MDEGEARKRRSVAHIQKVIEYMKIHGGNTPPDTYGPIGKKLYAIRHAFRNQKLIDKNKTPKTSYRLPREIARLYLIGDGVGGYG